jgi:hypothetical protein
MRATVKLTSDQKARVRAVPGLAERAAHEARKRFGSFVPLEEMVRSAHYGIALAALSFDEAVGTGFEQWAFFKALWTIVDDARTERRRAAGITAGRLAVIEFLRFEHAGPRDDDACTTEQQDRAELGRYKAGLLASYLKGLAVMPASAGGEDEMNARLDAARAAEKLDKVYEGLQPEQLQLLECESEADLKALGAAWGKSWWTLGRARNKLRKIIGARLLGQRMDEMPAWDDEVWAAVAAARGDKGATEGPDVP